MTAFLAPAAISGRAYLAPAAPTSAETPPPPHVEPPAQSGGHKRGRGRSRTRSR